MVNFVILVLVGGGLGAMLREFVMLMVPNPVDGFPLDILVANLLAAFLLGLVTALHRWQVLSDDVNMLLGAGIMAALLLTTAFTDAFRMTLAFGLPYLGFLAIIYYLRYRAPAVASS